MKQTAVEWFFEQIMYADVDIKVWRQNFEQAKAMEKEQIINAVDGFPLDKRHLEGEQYYNETYKKD